MRVAVIHDWLTDWGGAEEVLKNILALFPGSDVFTIVHSMSAEKTRQLNAGIITTSFIDRLPFGRSKYRALLPLMPIAIEQFDLAEYDLVISSSHAVAKGVLLGPNQIHVSYIHTPARYAWDLQNQYLAQAGLSGTIRGFLPRIILHYMRNWDFASGSRPDCLIANSRFVSRRIMKCYRRPAEIVYPPVNTVQFSPSNVQREDFYFTASRMVPYKRIDLIVDAFRHMPDRRLLVAGEGPDFPKLSQGAPANVQFLGRVSNEDLVDKLRRCKAFLFAAEEDFGIAPVEAQACGAPVIAYGRGGAMETVLNGITGLHFHRQVPEALVETIEVFEREWQGRMDASAIRQHAETFSTEVFRERFMKVIQEAMAPITRS